MLMYMAEYTTHREERVQSGWRALTPASEPSESPEMLISHRWTSRDPWAWFKEQGRETGLAEEARGLALKAANFSLRLG